MAAYFGKIETYFVNIFSPNERLPTPTGQRSMNLLGTFGKAILFFIPQGSPLPKNRKRPSQNVFDVYYRVNDWEAILDVLRNEKPVFFNYEDTTNVAQIYTDMEPVGEGES